VMPVGAHTRVVRGVSEARGLAGSELGVSPWHTVTQDEIDAFANVTQDLQWIHVDVARARRGPTGGTIAHGLYILSLGPKFMSEIVRWDGFSLMLNYGYDRVRFPAPLPVNSRIHMRMTLDAVDDAPGGAQLTLSQVFEREGSERPVCAATFLMRLQEEST
jgi:acyl dehydratase